MFTFPNPILKPGPATSLLMAHNIHTFHEAAFWIWKLPYGRTSDRSNFLLVPIEQRGACSAKHAFLAEVALEQSIPLSLTIGIFMMNHHNTPGIGPLLIENGLQAIPEAHCYLRFQTERYDFTSYDESTIPHPKLDFIYEETISSEQIGHYKIEVHRRWLELWGQQTNQKLNLDELWSIREKCIGALS